MDRRAFITMVGGSILAAPLLAQGQPQSAKVYTIGVITNTGSAADVSGPNPRNQNVAALLRGLREFGYEHGRDFVMEARCTEGRFEQSQILAWVAPSTARRAGQLLPHPRPQNNPREGGSLANHPRKAGSSCL